MWIDVVGDVCIIMLLINIRVIILSGSDVNNALIKAWLVARHFYEGHMGSIDFWQPALSMDIRQGADDTEGEKGTSLFPAVMISSENCSFLQEWPKSKGVQARESGREVVGMEEFV